MLSSTFPYPPTRGGTQVRTFNLLRTLSQRHSIYLGTLRGPDVTTAEIEALQQFVTELAIFPRPPKSSLPGTWGKLKRFGQFVLNGTPPNVLSAYSPALQAWVDQLVTTQPCDVISCEHSVNEVYIRPQWRQQQQTVVNIHSSVSETCRQLIETGTSENPLRDRLFLPLLTRYERHYCAKFSHLVVTTPEDGRGLQALLTNRKSQIVGSSHPPITIIPNGVDLDEFPYRPVDPGGHRLIFAGAMDNLPNIDAVKFLSFEILPPLQQRFPDTTLTLVGARPVSEVLELGQRPGVTVVGRVPRVADFLHRATVCVIPLRIGWGIKNKTLEAMATGTPVVASDRGLEGISITGPAGLRVLQANSIEEYVEAISRLFADSQLRQQLSRNARALIEAEYTWESIGKSYEQVLCG